MNGTLDQKRNSSSRSFLDHPIWLYLLQKFTPDMLTNKFVCLCISGIRWHSREHRQFALFRFWCLVFFSAVRAAWPPPGLVNFCVCFFFRALFCLFMAHSIASLWSPSLHFSLLACFLSWSNYRCVYFPLLSPNVKCLLIMNLWIRKPQNGWIP